MSIALLAIRTSDCDTVKREASVTLTDTDPPCAEVISTLPEAHPVPDEIETLPPAARALSALQPALNDKLPPAPLSPAPAPTVTEPPAPPEALPVSIDNAPELPPAERPLLTLTSPLLLPAPLALAEPTATLPLELDELTPLVTLTLPPLRLPP